MTLFYSFYISMKDTVTTSSNNQKYGSDKPHMLSKWDGRMLKEQVYEGKYQQGLK